MKPKFLFVSTFILFAASASAATIRISSLRSLNGSDPDTLLLSAGLDPIATGFASSGKFNIDDAAVDALIVASMTTGNYTSLIGAFNGFIGSDNFNTGVDFIFGIGAVPGAFAISADLNPTAHINATLYTFIGNGANLGSSNEFALYRHSEKLTADGSLPTPPNNYSIVLDGGSLLIGTATTYLSTDAGLGTNGTSVDAIRLSPTVPEPSGLLFSLIGVFGLLRRKR